MKSIFRSIFRFQQTSYIQQTSLHRQITCVLVPLRVPSRSLSTFGLAQNQQQEFRNNGFLVIKNFFSKEDCKEMKQRANEIIDNMDLSTHPRLKFGKKQAIEQDDETQYFFKSIDNISFFFESKAFDENGELRVPKRNALLKLGHGMHKLDPIFKKHISQERMRAIAKSLGYKQPLVSQSSYIFKQPFIGSEVPFHQDSTFIGTEPLSNLGFWFALDDSHLGNGCLHVLPGSHKNGITRRFVRNQKGNAGVFVGEDPEWKKSEFVPVEVETGTLILIHGEVVHYTAENTSPFSRNAFIFHVFEGEAKYSPENCLQPTPDSPFMPL